MRTSSDGSASDGSLLVFLSDFPLIFPWDRFIMGYHGVHLLRPTVELDGLATIFVASGSGFLVGTLRGILLGVFLEYFTIYIVPGSIHQACFFTGRRIVRMVCILFLALSGVELIGFGWRGGFSYLAFTVMTGTFGFCLVGIVISVTTFVNLLRNVHELEHFECILVGLSLEISAL